MSDPTTAHPSEATEPTSIARFSSADVDEVRDTLNRFFYPIAVGAPDGMERFNLDVDVICLGPMTIGQLQFASSVTLLASELDAYHLTMPLTGRTTARQAGREILRGVFGSIRGGKRRCRTTEASRALTATLAPRSIAIQMVPRLPVTRISVLTRCRAGRRTSYPS